MASDDRTRRFGSRTNALEAIADADLTGQTMLITGTTSGIGTETARALLLRGAHIVMANRNLVESEAQKARLLAEKPDARIDLIACDLSSLQSVQAAAAQYKASGWPLHALILNAGVFQPVQKSTIDGYEMTFGVNHLAHFYLIRELLPLLRSSTPSRLVIVSSHSHNHTGINATDPLDAKVARLVQFAESSEFGYRLYAYSKLCNVLTAFRLHRTEFEAHGIAVYVLHPGTMIATNISRGFGVLGKMFNALSKPFTKTLSQVHRPSVAQIPGRRDHRVLRRVAGSRERFRQVLGELLGRREAAAGQPGAQHRTAGFASNLRRLA